MKHFKRQQIEEAISREMAEVGSEPSSGLRTRMKRLLSLDRDLGFKAKDAARGKASYAFFSADAPGTGTEVLFSEYEAYALFMGVRWLAYEWPQSFVVQTLQSIRPEFEREHRRILGLDQRKLFDKEAIQKNSKNSFFEGTNASSSFLLIVSDTGIRGSKKTTPYCRIFQDPLNAFEFQMKEAGRSCTWYELVKSAWSMHNTLADTIPRSRGRTG